MSTPQRELSAKNIKTIKKFEKRIQKEIVSNQESKEFIFNIVEPNVWTFTYTIPQGMYAGQIHTVEVRLIYGVAPDIYIYPENPPLCKFLTPIWHPNISKNGSICLDVLKHEWSPCMMTSTILNALLILFENPNPSSPLNGDAARMYTKDKAEYDRYVNEYYNTKKD